MRDLNKPKYEALLKCCKSQGFHLEHETINNDNCEEIISPFIQINTLPYKREGLCFCNKKLTKNVFVLQCYNKVFIECGKTCLKTVFGSEEEIKKRANSKIKKDFLDGTLNNRLGFEKIDDYERYIIEVITRLVKDLSTRKLLILKAEYSENDDIVNIINDELLERQRIEDEERKKQEREEKKRLEERKRQEIERKKQEREEKKRLEEQKEIEKQRLIDIKRSQDEYEEKERLRKIRIAEQKKRNEEFNKWVNEYNEKKKEEIKNKNNKLQDFIKSMRDEAIRNNDKLS